MSARTKIVKVGTIDYQANAPIPFRVNVPSRYLWAIHLELSGTLNVTVGGGTVLARSPGTLCDIRCMLDQSDTIKQGRWSSFAIERAYLYDVLPTEVNVAAGVAAHPFSSWCELPMANKWSPYPHDTIIDMANHQRVDLQITMRDENSLLNGGTKAFSVNPTIDVWVECSDVAPEPSAAGYFVQREIDSAALGAALNADLNIPLVFGPDHNYTAFVLSALDVHCFEVRSVV
jgi:hypothetical protein